VLNVHTRIKTQQSHHLQSSLNDRTLLSAQFFALSTLACLQVANPTPKKNKKIKVIEV